MNLGALDKLVLYKSDDKNKNLKSDGLSIYDFFLADLQWPTGFLEHCSPNLNFNKSQI